MSENTSGSRADRPFDRGLQPERTALAWRRSCLALTVGSLVAVRILPDLLGAWALILTGFGVAASIALMVASHYRYISHHTTLTSAETDRVALHGGGLIAALSVFAVGAGLVAFIVVIALVGQRLLFA